MRNSAKVDRHRLEAKRRAKSVVELRAQGKSWRVIAKELGYAGPSGAHKAFQTEVAAIPATALAEARAKADAILDSVLRGHLNRAEKGNCDSAQVVLKAVSEFTKIHGVAAAFRVKVEVDEQLEGFLDRLKAKLPPEVYDQVLLAGADESMSGSTGGAEEDSESGEASGDR